jgi:hypothetical protein
MTIFIKSPQAIKEYEKYGRKFPNEVAHINHEQFLAQCAKSPALLNFCVILGLQRVRSSYINPEHDKLFKDKEQREGTKMRQYLTCSLSYHRTDSLGNIKHSFQPHIGIGPKLQPVMRIRRDAQGYEEKYVSNVSIIGNTYYYPYYGPESVHKFLEELEREYGATLRDLSTEEGRRKSTQDQMKREKWAAEHDKVVYQPQEGEQTRFSVNQEGWQRNHTCSDFESFCNADFDDIVQFAHTPTDKERKDRLAAIEVDKVRRMADSANTGMADELDRARNRLNDEHFK